MVTRYRGMVSLLCACVLLCPGLLAQYALPVFQRRHIEWQLDPGMNLAGAVPATHAVAESLACQTHRAADIGTAIPLHEREQARHEFRPVTLIAQHEIQMCPYAFEPRAGIFLACQLVQIAAVPGQRVTDLVQYRFQLRAIGAESHHAPASRSKAVTPDIEPHVGIRMRRAIADEPDDVGVNLRNQYASHVWRQLRANGKRNRLLCVAAS